MVEVEVDDVSGTAFGCLFSGEVPISRLLQVADEFVKADAVEITRSDTSGLAIPLQVQQIIIEFQKLFKNDV